MNLSNFLTRIPQGLKDPLLSEYNSIFQHFLERRWLPSELSGGRFSEIVYTILDGYAKGEYAEKPYKPSNFVDACRKLETYSEVPRSFQILIPRILLSLYEIRNNRNVGHVGGDIDPNFMDASLITHMSSWILAELIRVYHNVSILEAQKVVDFITERKIPLIWEAETTKRVLNPRLKMKDQILLLTASSSSVTRSDQLSDWIEPSNSAYFMKTISNLHNNRFIEYNKIEKTVRILPPGIKYIEKILVNQKYF